MEICLGCDAIVTDMTKHAKSCKAWKARVKAMNAKPVPPKWAVRQVPTPAA